MKRLISLLLALLLMLLCVGCAGTTPATGNDGQGTEGNGKKPVEEEVVTASSELKAVEGDRLAADDMAYVMIYNPHVYYEVLGNDNEKLSVGSFGDQIDVGMFRGEEEEIEIPFNPITPGEVSPDFDELELGQSRAEVTITPYQVGDICDFYAFDGGEDIFTQSPTVSNQTFVCRYAGKYGNIWTTENSSAMSDAIVEAYGEEVDNNIYEAVTETFGPIRFADNGGKVNILMCALPAGYLGVSRTGDALASDEISPYEAEFYGINTDHAIVYVNEKEAAASQYMEMTFGTIAHELQHNACTAATLSRYDMLFMNTWINEAMSGYIEENLYPGSKDVNGHIRSFNRSEQVRSGQSLYNFNTDYDIGVYGSVYFYSEYLASLGGKEAFSRLYEYWTECYDNDFSEPAAVLTAVGEDAVDEIDDRISYPDDIQFNYADEEQFSKLTLDFYLSMLSYDNEDPDAFSKIEPMALLYGEINPANIEGGGRVIVALKDAEYVIPDDADEGLIYIGLDEDFRPVTDLLYH